jgi:hypothetical protein
MNSTSTGNTDTRDAIVKALANLSHSRGLIYGTTDLVESVKNHLQQTYTDLAKKAGVSTMGIRRWRDNNSGDPLHLNQFIEFAKREATKKDETAADVSRATNPAVLASLDAPDESVSEKFKYLPIKDVEQTLLDALKSRHGLASTSCRVINVEIDGPAVRVTFIVE